MEKVILNAEIREERGKSKVKHLREKDIIPAVVYRGGTESVHIKVTRSDLLDVLHTSQGDNVIVTLKTKGDKKKGDKTCIIKRYKKIL